MSRIIHSKELTTLVTSVLEAVGSTTHEANTVAENLVLANLCGHDSHGVGMVPRYVDAVREGGLIPNTSVQIRKDAGSMLGLDGARGYGQIVGVQAMDLAVERVRAHGSCIVALAGAHHLGRIGHFAEHLAAQGYVSIHFVNVLARSLVAPWGGSDARFGTNPMCVGVPLGTDAPSGTDASSGDRGSFILDFATSRVAQGKMRVAYNKGERVDEGLLIDHHGKPTTHPRVVVTPETDASGQALWGALLPFGEHKGSGLAMACELLGGALTGGGTWHQPNNTRRSIYNSMFSIVIDPKAVGDATGFEQQALAFIDWCKASPAANANSPVRYAGEPERAKRVERTRDGIEIDDGTWKELATIATSLRVAIPV
jgi:hydroxycarboxylate dehydrogenase B